MEQLFDQNVCILVNEKGKIIEHFPFLFQYWLVAFDFDFQIGDWRRGIDAIIVVLCKAKHQFIDRWSERTFMMIECNDGPNRMIDRNYKSQFKLITCGSNTSASKRPYKRHEYVINQWKECQERRLSEHFIPIPGESNTICR